MALDTSNFHLDPQSSGNINNSSSHSPVMSCLEHQKLSRADFKYAIDFDYLIEQELPCFTLEIKRGQLFLVVSHYLAKIILPSGMILEILPKISVNTAGAIRGFSKTDDHQNKKQMEIKQARQWVARMLQDIEQDDLGKTIAATSLVQATEGYRPPLPQLQSTLSWPTNLSHEKPWYEGLLAKISQLLQQAATVLPNTYQSQASNRPKAQGKINLNAQLKNNWHRPHYLYTEQSIFKTDQLLAQFLVTAWQQLQKLSPESAPVFSRLERQIPEILRGQVALTLPPQSWQASYQQLQLRSQTWQSQLGTGATQTIIQAVEWGWWLLTQAMWEQAPRQGQGSQAQQRPTSALMINMNHAFERWVLGKLQRWIAANLPQSSLMIHPSFEWLYSISLASPTKQPSTVLQRLIPDACIVAQTGEVSHVIDIKYKTLTGVTQISGADWQQLYCYQQYVKSENAWLIYPQTINFTQRLDVSDNLAENRQSNQQGMVETDTRKMSVIPFDPHQGLLLI